MRHGRGFTLIELMVVILVLSILAAVAIPILRGRTSAAKWSEGKAMMGIIASAIRLYCAGEGTIAPPQSLWLGEANNLGFGRGDFDGAYFDGNDFSFDVTSINPPVFTVTGTKTGLFPEQYQLDQDGHWTP